MKPSTDPGAARRPDPGDADAAPRATQVLHVIPHERREGFWANIRGHVLELADPDSGRALAPTPDDLFVVSIAAAAAWSARRFLRARKLPDYVSVSAEWRRREDHRPLAGIDLAVTLSKRAEHVGESLAEALENSLAAQSLAEPVVHISFAG